MKNKLQQIIYDMRHQPVIAWVTFIATAISIFLIMVVVMMQQVKIIPFSPESCRDRLLVGAFLHTAEIGNEGNNGSSGLSYPTAKKLYADLDGIEHTSYFGLWTDDSDVKGSGTEAFSAKSRRASSSRFSTIR